MCSKDQKIVSTLDETVLTSPRLQDISALSPCNHEEADTRLLLHAFDATKRQIRTVDSDVLVIADALCNEIKTEQLWIAFGTGQNLRYLPVHSYLCDQSHCWHSTPSLGVTKPLLSQTEARLHGQYGKFMKKLHQHYMLQVRLQARKWWKM